MVCSFGKRPVGTRFKQLQAIGPSIAHSINQNYSVWLWRGMSGAAGPGVPLATDDRKCARQTSGCHISQSRCCRANRSLAGSLIRRRISGRFTFAMATSKSSPYGSWKSPITSDLIVAQSISLTEVRLDGRNVHWLEGRPQEQGRFVIVRAGRSGNQDLVPKPLSARTRVHEYGGASWTVDNGVTY